jgi:hypothetical protein
LIEFSKATIRRTFQCRHRPDFELVINLSTAKSLSLDVPLQLQQRSFRDMSSFGYAECRVDPAMAQYRSKLALMLQELFSFMVLPYATSGL